MNTLRKELRPDFATFDPMAFNTTKDKKGKYHEPTVEEVMKKIWR